MAWLSDQGFHSKIFCTSIVNDAPQLTPSKIWQSVFDRLLPEKTLIKLVSLLNHVLSVLLNEIAFESEIPYLLNASLT